MEAECGCECEVHGGMHGESCSCPCHPAGAETCAGCTSMHGKTVDPVEMGVVMWKKAFLEAMTQLQAEKLKKRIDAAWGPTMDKVADAALEAMGKQWQSMLQLSGAEQELREKIARIWSEAPKK